MPISFDAIPALRTPGTYIEFNNELAGATSTEFKAVIYGQRLTTGTVAEGIPTRVTDPAQASKYFGLGSMLHKMCSKFLTANATTPVYVIALDDNAAGTAAAGTITVTAAPTTAGTLYVYVGGESVSVGIASDDAIADVATNIAAAINAATYLPVTAAAAAGVVTVTARHKGEVFNGLQLHASYYDEAQPDGLAITFVNLTGGAGNPDVTTAIDAMGDVWYNWIVNPYTDTANLLALKTELDNRYGPLVQQGARAFAAYSGTLSATATFGEGHNSPHLSVLGTNGAVTPIYECAAINGAVAAFNLAIDPARPLQTLKLVGMLPPKADRWIRAERDSLLYDGIATYKVDPDGTCRIERQITTYQTNASGLPDASYLDINTPETLERIRYEQRATIAQNYPRHKLADDGTNYGAGQAIVTPKLVKATLIALYRDFESRGWAEGFDIYVNNLIVERDISDRNRINWRDTPNLVNQARVFAGKTQFIL
ncbi:phage tail sheath subtilisin-like domain-containing protein [Thalassolituus oleivorans]|uniref:Bacteriophage Mu tail sheath protein (GpL) n=1 Tax=Thalassolituus oleivorans MIL-1 TaxID=1298593 RepID=M5DNC0_9GAMM|nr:phage tail sheath subtilisin-like domain-containing protein [Thalassolituus oleivorans]CCU70938.1 bacteriophage Mu tail sheath protein (GpL) [Thalassolituus oleivorans MIL-1]